jgi:GcrA cell cycle regulator
VSLSHTWTNERVNKLSKLWGEKYSASAIADILGLQSRGQVLGKLYRLNMLRRPRNQESDTWTPERTKAATQLWREGYSATAIARTLGLASRSQVLGKIGRLNLQRQRRKTPYRPRQWRPRKTPQPKIIEIPIVYDPSHQLPLLDANSGQCRWINGEPSGASTLVCGAPVAGEVSWCPYHSNLVYAKRRGKEQSLQEKRKPTGITLRAAVGLRL